MRTLTLSLLCCLLGVSLWQCVRPAPREAVSTRLAPAETPAPAAGRAAEPLSRFPEPVSRLARTPAEVSPAPASTGNREVKRLLNLARFQGRLAEWGAELAADGSRPAVATLLKAIALAEEEERPHLARSLQALHSPDAAAELQEFLVRNAADPAVAVQARDALGRIATAADVTRLREALSAEPEPGLVRSYLLGALERVRQPEAVPQLAELSAAPDPALHTAAAVALGGIGSPEAVDALVGLIEKVPIGDMDDPAVQALLSVRNKDAEVRLYEVYAGTTNAMLKYATTQALLAIQGRAAQQAQLR